MSAKYGATDEALEKIAQTGEENQDTDIRWSEATDLHILY